MPVHNIAVNNQGKHGSLRIYIRTYIYLSIVINRVGCFHPLQCVSCPTVHRMPCHPFDRYDSPVTDDKLRIWWWGVMITSRRDADEKL